MVWLIQIFLFFNLKNETVFMKLWEYQNVLSDIYWDKYIRYSIDMLVIYYVQEFKLRTRYFCYVIDIYLSELHDDSDIDRWSKIKSINGLSCSDIAGMQFLEEKGIGIA